MVRKTLSDRFDYDYSGMYKISARLQRREFQKALDQRTGSHGNLPDDWFEAFDHLKSYLLSLGKEKVVVFLDELPWMVF